MTADRETPLTDAKVVVCDGAPGYLHMVDADFARALERDLAAAQEELAKMRNECGPQVIEQANAWHTVTDTLTKLNIPWHVGATRSGLRGVVEEINKLHHCAESAESRLNAVAEAVQREAAKVCEEHAALCLEDEIYDNTRGVITGDGTSFNEGVKAAVTAIRALDLPAIVAAVPSCTWTEDSDGTWNTKCGEMFQFNEGGPEENNFKFCHGCGKKVSAEPFKYDNTDDTDAAVKEGK